MLLKLWLWLYAKKKPRIVYRRWNSWNVLEKLFNYFWVWWNNSLSHESTYPRNMQVQIFCHSRQIFELHEVPQWRDPSVTWPNGRAAQLCRSRSYRLQQSCRSVQHGPTHVLSSLHFKSSPVFVSLLYCKKFLVHVGQLCSRRATNSWFELERESEGEGGAVTRKSQFAIRPLLVRLYTPDLVLCGNQF